MLSRMILTLSLSSALVAMAMTTNAQQPAAAGFEAPSEAWRSVDPENLMIIETKYGNIGVELFPEIAPKHVTQVKTLTRQGFYNNVPFHRVISNFMNQTGDGSKGDGTGDSDLPNIPPEFTFKRGPDMAFKKLSSRQFGISVYGVGFYKGLPIASQPDSQALFTKDGKVDAFGVHCKGVTSMARTDDPTTANSQFFLMRAESRALNQTYSIWGNTVMGFDLLEKPVVGTVGERPGWIPDVMDKVYIASDLPKGEQPKIQVLRPEHPAFLTWANAKIKANGSFPGICELAIPTRVL